MAGVRYQLFRAAIEALYFSGAHRMLRPIVGGVGAILTLHHVRPARPGQFQPNRLLEVTPSFFEQVMQRLRRSGADIVSMDEVHRRLKEQEFPRRFVSVTFDDGYRDTREFAYPILKKYDVPFTVYVATSFADRVGELWWLALEAAIGHNDVIQCRIDGRECRFECRDVHDKRATFEKIHGSLRRIETEDELRNVMRDITARHRVDMAAFCNELCMDWKELAEFATDPLVTIGAHTVSHPILSKLDDNSVRSELANCRAAIEAALGTRPRHLAYPVGDRGAAGPREFKIAADLGFETAVTTRPGVIFPEHARHLAALPRISLNGNFQQPRFTDVLISGAATGLWNGFHRLNVA